MNHPAARRFASCIARDIARIGRTAYRVARYYLPFHIRGFIRSIFQRSPKC